MATILDFVQGDDKKLFTQAACHRLAKAINDLTGWPIYAFWDGEDYDVHTFVKMPNGDYLDIEGAKSPEAFMLRWTEYSPRYVPSFDLLDDWDGDWFDVDYADERAAIIAPELVSKYGPDSI